jgi:hypothetical protein
MTQIGNCDAQPQQFLIGREHSAAGKPYFFSILQLYMTRCNYRMIASGGTDGSKSRGNPRMYVQRPVVAMAAAIGYVLHRHMPDDRRWAKPVTPSHPVEGPEEAVEPTASQPILIDHRLVCALFTQTSMQTVVFTACFIYYMQFKGNTAANTQLYHTYTRNVVLCPTLASYLFLGVIECHVTELCDCPLSCSSSSCAPLWDDVSSCNLLGWTGLEYRDAPI